MAEASVEASAAASAEVPTVAASAEVPTAVAPTGAASAAAPMAAAAEAGAEVPDSESIDITVLRCCDGS